MSQDMGDLVSVITPAFNAQRHIGEAIGSVITQEHPNWELLVINDGSTDNSGEIVQSFCDKRISYFEQENRGVSAARNVGLANMKGDYFCFLDADDRLPSDSLASRLKVFRDNDNIDFADGAVHCYNEAFTIKLKSWTPDFFGNPLHDLLSLSGRSFFGPSWMIKRKPNVRYAFNESLTHGEDLLFYINLARAGGRYGYTSEAVLNYRTGHTSAMTNLSGLEEGYRKIYQELEKMLDVPGAWKKQYYKKMKTILLKSYLGKGKWFNALRTLFR